jgi:hypothetical protein
MLLLVIILHIYEAFMFKKKTYLQKYLHLVQKFDQLKKALAFDRSVQPNSTLRHS